MRIYKVLFNRKVGSVRQIGLQQLCWGLFCVSNRKSEKVIENGVYYRYNKSD